jgi:hypothetical protein
VRFQELARRGPGGLGVRLPGGNHGVCALLAIGDLLRCHAVSFLPVSMGDEARRASELRHPPVLSWGYEHEGSD